MIEIEMVRTNNVARAIFEMRMHRHVINNENIQIFISPAALQNLLKFEPQEFLGRSCTFEDSSYTNPVEHIKLFGYLHVWYKEPAVSNEWPLYSILGISWGDEKKIFRDGKTSEKFIILDLKA